MTTLTDLRDTANDRRATFNGARAEAAALRTEIAEIHARIDFLESAPLSKVELTTELARQVTAFRDAAAHDTDLVRHLDHMRTRPLIAMGATEGNLAPFSPTVLPAVAAAVRVLLVDPEAILAALSSVIDGLDFAQAGPSLADRAGELATRRTRLTEAQTALADLEKAIDAYPRVA